MDKQNKHFRIWCFFNFWNHKYSLLFEIFLIYDDKIRVRSFIKGVQSYALHTYMLKPH